MACDCTNTHNIMNTQVCKDESVKLIEPGRALFTPSPTEKALSVRYYRDATSTPAPKVCNNLQKFNADNNRYLIVLKDCDNALGAERLMNIAKKYQSCLIYLPYVCQLQGTLSNEALLKVCTHACMHIYICMYVRI